MSEMVSQFLIFLGLFAFLLWEERGAAPFGALAGLAFGASLLVRIDSFLIVAPLGAWLAIRLADGSLRWRKALVLLVPFTLLSIHAALHAVYFTLKYLVEITNRPYWRHPPAVWIALLGSSLVALLLAKRFGPALVAFVEARARGVQALVTVAVVVLALYAYFLRPELSLLAGADGNDPALALTELGPLKPLGFQFLAAHDAQSLVRLGWFVTPLRRKSTRLNSSHIQKYRMPSSA